MTYETFKIAMTAEVANIVGEEVDVRLHRIPKNNGVVLDAMTIMPCDCHVAPTIYLSDYFTRYQKGEVVKTLAKEVVHMSLNHPMEQMIPKDFFLEYDSIKERVCYKLINYEKNVDLLNDLPHVHVLDLALIFYYVIESNVLGRATVLIRNVDLQRWNISKEEVIARAKVNTPKILPWRFTSIHKIVSRLVLGGPEKALEEIDQSHEIIAEDMETVPMYILTNQEKHFGAACIFYPKLLSMIADELDSDLYILPSSIHECIIMPVSGCYSKESLSEMVREINEKEVDEVEVLADHAYYYDRKLEEIYM